MQPLQIWIIWIILCVRLSSKNLLPALSVSSLTNLVWNTVEKQAIHSKKRKSLTATCVIDFLIVMLQVGICVSTIGAPIETLINLSKYEQQIFINKTFLL